MSNTIDAETFRKALFALLKETFTQGEGIYLDSRTSLFETLETVSTEEASRPVSAQGSNIAAHVDHARLYLEVLEKHLQHQEIGKVEWEDIWRNMHSVTPEEWATLKQNLRDAYGRVVALLENWNNWDGTSQIGDALAILAHNAYHLGAIRQILFVVR